jgi:hypothetical protein
MRNGCLVDVTINPFDSKGELAMSFVFLPITVLWRPQCAVVFSKFVTVLKKLKLYL